MRKYEEIGYMKTVLVTGPTGTFLSLDDVKEHLRVDHDASDGLIQSLIYAATAQVENITNRKMVTQTWKAYADEWPTAFFTLPYGNLQAVTSVSYTLEDGTVNTLDISRYIVDSASDPGRILLSPNQDWPTDTLYPSNPIEIEFTCGYGSHTIQNIEAVSNTSPIVITIEDHGHSTADRVIVSGVTGNTNANGPWKITKISDDTFSLNASTGNAEYVSGGTVVKIDVPEPIMIASMVLIGDMYAHRESRVIGPNFKYTEVPGYITSMIQSYRLFNRG